MIATLLACAAPEGTGTPPAPSVTSPTDVPWVLETAAPAEVDLPAAIDALQAGIALVRAISPEPVLDVYRDLVGGADPGCPARYESDGVDYWLDRCTASTGTFFDGYAVDDEQLVSDPSGAYLVATTAGAAWIEAADGTWLELDGAAQVVSAEADGVTQATLVLAGRFATNHPLAAGTWLDRGVRPTLVATTYDIGGVDAAFAVVGAIDDLGGPFPAVAFDDAVVLDDALGYGGCALEPTGVVSVRTADGSWIDVVFDPVLVDDVVTVDPARCDGCGQGWHRDAPLGEVCLDFAGWL